MTIDLPTADLPKPTPGVGFSLVNVVTCPLVIICLSLFSALIGVAHMDVKKSEKGRIGYSRILAFVVIAVTMIYLYLFTSVLLSTNLDDNRDLCRTTYDVLASFWIAGKVTVYLWFQEKLHIRRFMAGLQDRRFVPWTVFNSTIMAAPFIMVLYYIFADRDSKIKGDGCNIGVTHSVGVAYALAYFLFINAYYCLHFIYLFPAVRCILIPHWPPGTEAYYCLEVLKTPPFPVPVATPWGRYYERRAAVTLAIFNAITAIAPVTTCVLMLSLDEGLGGQWWTFAVVICGDLVISAFGIGIWEARLWKVMKEYTPEEQKRKLKQARETSLCPSCGQGRGLVADGCSSRKSWWS